MKKLAYILSVVAVLVVMSILIFLLFKMDSSNTDEKDNNIYATDISITVESRSISLHVNNFLKFNVLPYKVEPENYNQEIKIELLDNLGKPKDNCSFNNNVFKATEKGSYYIKFIATTRYSTELSDTLKIDVLDEHLESYANLQTTTPSIRATTNEPIDISGYVIANSIDKTDLCYSCNVGTIKGVNFFPTAIGEADIEISYTKAFYTISTSLKVIVTEDQSYNIELYDKFDNLIQHEDIITVKLSEKKLMLSYIVKGLTSQKIELLVQDTNILILESKDPPIIVLKLLATGRTEVTIKIPDKDYMHKIIIEVI